MSRESFARANNSVNLEMESGVTHDVDRLTAMAGGNTLGGLLLRFRESEQPQWAKRIVLILAKRVAAAQNLTRSIAIRVAVCALEEFRSPWCGVCNGAREVLFDKIKITCGSCAGSGLQRRTNAARRARIGTYGARIDAGMAACHKDMANALAAFISRAAWRLE